MEFSETLIAQQQVARLQALLEASRQIHSTIRLDEVLSIALKILVRELELTGAFFSTLEHSYGDVTAHIRAGGYPSHSGNPYIWGLRFSCAK